MLKENLGLITVRQVAEGKFNHCFISDTLVESRVTLSNKGIAYIFPLYLYDQEKPNKLFNQDKEGRESNLAPQLSKIINNTYNLIVQPEEILDYIYAILYSNIYRKTYADFLKFDFPRVPFTADSALFQQMAALGKRLVDLHLLRSPELDQPIARFEGKGDDLTIAAPKYDPKTKRVWINATYYFEGITPEVWQYQIGGYQVLDKYLKARKGRSLEDPRHILRVATALANTIEIQKEIDALYPKVEEDLIEFS